MGSETLALDGGQFSATRRDLSPGRGLAVNMGQHAGWAIIKQVQTQWRRNGNFLLQQESNTESPVV